MNRTTITIINIPGKGTGLCDPFSRKRDQNEPSMTHAAGQFRLSAQFVTRVCVCCSWAKHPTVWLTHFRSSNAGHLWKCFPWFSVFSSHNLIANLNHSSSVIIISFFLSLYLWKWYHILAESEQTQKSLQERTGTCAECNECFGTKVKFLLVTLPAVMSGCVCLWMVQNNKGM